jgi:hypothetical protein
MKRLRYEDRQPTITGPARGAWLKPPFSHSDRASCDADVHSAQGGLRRKIERGHGTDIHLIGAEDGMEMCAAKPSMLAGASAASVRCDAGHGGADAILQSYTTFN